MSWAQKNKCNIAFTTASMALKDDDEKALCKEAGNKLIERMLRPYERVLIPDWCPLKTNKQK